MKLGITTVAALGIFVTVGLAGCSSDDHKGAPPALPTASSAAAGSQIASPDVAPTAASLSALLKRALDPKVPSSEKTQLVQGASGDAALFDELVKAGQDNPDVQWTIVDPVTLDAPGQATASISANINGAQQSAKVTVVFENGTWKLSRADACNILKQIGKAGSASACS